MGVSVLCCRFEVVIVSRSPSASPLRCCHYMTYNYVIIAMYARVVFPGDGIVGAHMRIFSHAGELAMCILL